ncbi:hypothetical protein JCM8097_008441 [Rhodosporidiobolus ruineniae]
MLAALPDPVLYRILLHAVPPPGARTTPLRYRLLLRLSKVCRSLARVAQELLYAHIDILTLDKLRALRIAVDGPESAPRARLLAFNKARSLRVSAPAKGYDKYRLGPVHVAKLVLDLPPIREAWFDGVNLNPLDLSWAVNLESLHLHEVTLVAPVQPSKWNVSSPWEAWYFPNLRFLSLSKVTVSSEPGHPHPSLRRLLHPVSFSKLTSLAISYDASTAEPIFRHLAPQLERLWLRRTSHPYLQDKLPSLPVDELALCTAKLRHLACDLHRTRDLEVLSELGAESTILIHRQRRSGGAESPDTKMARADSHSSSGSSSSRSTTVVSLPPYPWSDDAPSLRLRSFRLESPQVAAAERAFLTHPGLEWLPSLYALAVSRSANLYSSAPRPTKAEVEHFKEQRRATVEVCARAGIEVSELPFVDPEGGAEYQEYELARWTEWCDEVDARVEEEEELARGGAR